MQKDAGRPDPQNSTTASGTDDALETDIRQEEELAIREITQNRETSSPLQQITRNRTTNTDRQQTHDHRQERQHPEERRKNSRDSTSCSSLRAGAQETATTPNGRGERLNHERREQLQHQRRGDNDRLVPPPCNLKITQWNVQGLTNKRHTVQAAAIAKNIDVFILKETLMSNDKQFRLPGYQQYSVPKRPNSHGSMILVRATIPSSEVEPVHCVDGVEAQAVRIHLANDSLVVYNIYKPPTKRLEAGELLTQATQELVLIAGDFNAHHPTINSTTRMNQDGRHLVELLTDSENRINTFRRHFRQYPSPEGVKLLRAAVQHARQITQKIREDKWLEWCATFNAHTSLSELWRKLRIATGKLPRAPAHPQPLQEANRLAEHFAERSSSAQLPPEIRLHLQQVQLERVIVVRHAIEQADTTDCLFTIEEIRRARKTSKDTAPGSDGITYSLLSNAGLAGELALLTVINASWSAGKLPSAWKRTNIVPIPKPNDPPNFRPISLTACIGKAAERMVLTRLLWKTGPLHHNIFGFTKGLSTAHSLATLLGSIVQRALDLISKECMSLGLKISIPKSEAMRIGHNEPVTQLQIQATLLLCRPANLPSATMLPCHPTALSYFDPAALPHGHLAALLPYHPAAMPICRAYHPAALATCRFATLPTFPWPASLSPCRHSSLPSRQPTLSHPAILLPVQHTSTLRWAAGLFTLLSYSGADLWYVGCVVVGRVCCGGYATYPTRCPPDQPSDQLPTRRDAHPTSHPTSYLPDEMPKRPATRPAKTDPTSYPTSYLRRDAPNVQPPDQPPDQLPTRRDAQTSSHPTSYLPDEMPKRPATRPATYPTRCPNDQPPDQPPDHKYLFCL
ncbi:RNA-directed DNA polymerase from mobile element jockey-like 15 [Homarus americanus]|uniref:RNA-directed DNA polymerase from mobile element jockey-like 15 n=1 Tax=Homarus americanus TaxID=6706 RepID=A0A8J5MWE4_HOMAM|nr:RNA-directed DNA polymerase from mobile element jockey-like 15 [Homarus americanus]